MKEVIVRLTADHIKVKGAEYVQDLVRCGECKHWNIEALHCNRDRGLICAELDDFCSYGEVRDE